MATQARISVSPHDREPVKNDTVSVIPTGTIVKHNTTQDGVVPVAASTDSHAGVVLADIDPGLYGTIARGGRVPCLAGANVAIGDDIMPNAAGRGVPWAAGAGVNAALVGKAQSAAVDGELFELEYSAPGLIKQG